MPLNVRSCFYGHLLLFILLSYCAYEVRAQHRTYSFNSPGNRCYFSYVIYSATDNYSTYKRPFVFVMGKEGQTADAAFRVDSLKSDLRFYNYLFVYIPNKGGDADNKLYCIEPLTSLMTGDYRFGKGNLFLYIKDTSVSQANIDNSVLKRVYKNVVIADDKVDTSKSIANEFKEDLSAYDALSQKDQEDFGTFYFEEDEANSDINIEHDFAPKRTYFGPPSAQNFTLTGIIRDKSTGEVLPFASIQIKENSKGTTSNADGLFTLLNVPSDTSTLVVNYIGFTNTEVFLTPAASKKYFVVDLLPASNMMKSVNIVGLKEDVVLSKKDEVGIVKMTPKKLEQLPNLGERDVMRSFQLMPGVSAANESSSGLYVRGGTPDQNLVLYDGFTVYHVDHLYGFFSAFNSNALKDVQLYKGGFESKFGGRLSSITEITGKDGNQKKFNLGGDISLLSMNVFTEIPIGEKFSSVIAFRRSYKGVIYNTIFDKFNTATTNLGGGNENMRGGGPGGMGQQENKVTNFFYDLNGKFTYRPTERDVIALSIFNGTDKLDNSNSMSAPSFGSSQNSFSSSTTDLTRYGNFGSSLRWSRKWGDRLYGNTIVSYSNYFSDRDRSQERTSTDANDVSTTTKSGVFENNDLKDYSIKSDYQWTLSDWNQVQFGVFSTLFDIDYSYAQNDTTTILDKHNRATLSGLYLQDKIKLFNDKLVVLPGIRASYYETTAKWYYEPRATLTYSLTDKLTVKGATGKYYQFANKVTREDILSGSRDFWLLSDGSSIPVSSSVHYIAGLSYETPDYLYSVEGYYKDISNLTEYSLRFNASPMGVDYNENFFSGNGYAKGVEFLLQRKVGKLNGWVSYTLAEARNRFDIYSNDWYPANQDVTHEFKIVGLYKYKRWDFSATWVFATGRPYTAPSGAYSVTLLDGTTQDFFTVTTKNGLRLPNYHRADISANYKILKGSKGDKRRRELGYIGLSIFNVYNRINVWYRQYAIEEGEVIQTNVNYLGFVPNLTLSLKLR